jgi:hypothetical protein
MADEKRDETVLSSLVTEPALPDSEWAVKEPARPAVDRNGRSGQLEVTTVPEPIDRSKN